MSIRRRIVRLAALAAMALLCGGCQWLQNEFFVYDAPAPPVPEAESGVAAPW